MHQFVKWFVGKIAAYHGLAPCHGVTMLTSENDRPSSICQPTLIVTRAGEWNYPGLPRYIAALECWFYAQQRIAYADAILPDWQWRLCLGVLVYGSYVDRFLRLCVPSLMAEGNLPVLEDPLVIVHTDLASAERLQIELTPLSEFARVEIHIVPQAIIDMIPEKDANKYWMLGAAHNLHMQQAKYRAHAYHMLMPDHIYGKGFFANLVRLALAGKRVIVQGAMSCVLEDVAPLLEQDNGEHDARRLNAMALDHLHEQIQPLVMNGREDYPGCTFMLFVASGAVHIVSPHMSIVYLSHDVLMRNSLRLFNTVDGQLPYFIPDDVEPYMPSPDDGMGYIEVSERAKPFNRGKGCLLMEFCVRFWTMAHCERGFERYFGLTTVLPFPDGYVPSIEPMTEAEIESIKTTVRNTVSESYDEIRAALPPIWRVDPLLRAAQEVAA